MIFYYDPLFWIAVSFFLLALVLFRPVKTRITAYLDARIAEIRSSLEKAQALREESRLNMTKNRAYQQQIQQEAQTIIEHAQEECRLLEEQAERDLETLIAQKNAQLQARITQMEVTAQRRIRETILTTAVAASRRLLQDRLASLESDPGADQVIAELPTFLREEGLTKGVLRITP